MSEKKQTNKQSDIERIAESFRQANLLLAESAKHAAKALKAFGGLKISKYRLIGYKFGKSQKGFKKYIKQDLIK